MNIERMMTEAFARDSQTLHARLAAVEQLARDLLARLSRDYGDYEGETDSEIDSLFERGEQLLPVDRHGIEQKGRFMQCEAFKPGCKNVAVHYVNGYFFCTRCAREFAEYTPEQIKIEGEKTGDPSFVCEGCGEDTHIRLNGLCLKCANRNRNE